MVGCFILLVAVVCAGGACLIGGPFLAIPVLLFFILVAVCAKP